LYWFSTILSLTQIINKEYENKILKPVVKYNQKSEDFIKLIFEYEVERVINLIGSNSIIEKNMLHSNSECTSLLSILNIFKKELVANYIKIEHQVEFFKQIFLYINNMTFNTLIKDNKYCTLKSGFNLKFSVSILENWAWEKKINEAKENLKLIRQASDLLSMNKQELSDKKVILEVCTALNINQVYKILSLYKHDVNDKKDVVIPKDVFNILKNLKNEGDDEPLELKNIVVSKNLFKKSDLENDNWKKVSPPESILKYIEFSFLKE
jgi:myosin heavy subunit